MMYSQLNFWDGIQNIKYFRGTFDENIFLQITTTVIIITFVYWQPSINIVQGETTDESIWTFIIAFTWAECFCYLMFMDFQEPNFSQSSHGFVELKCFDSFLLSILSAWLISIAKRLSEEVRKASTASGRRGFTVPSFSPFWSFAIEGTTLTSDDLDGFTAILKCLIFRSIAQVHSSWLEKLLSIRYEQNHWVRDEQMRIRYQTFHTIILPTSGTFVRLIEEVNCIVRIDLLTEKTFVGEGQQEAEHK